MVHDTKGHAYSSQHFSASARQHTKTCHLKLHADGRELFRSFWRLIFLICLFLGRTAQTAGWHGISAFLGVMALPRGMPLCLASAFPRPFQPAKPCLGLTPLGQHGFEEKFLLFL